MENIKNVMKLLIRETIEANKDIIDDASIDRINSTADQLIELELNGLVREFDNKIEVWCQEYRDNRFTPCSKIYKQLNLNLQNPLCSYYRCEIARIKKNKD